MLSWVVCRNVLDPMPQSDVPSCVAPYAAIGLGIGNTYHEGSRAALGTQGTLNAVSAGILIYNGIVDLIIPGDPAPAITNSCRSFLGQ